MAIDRQFHSHLITFKHDKDYPTHGRKK